MPWPPPLVCCFYVSSGDVQKNKQMNKPTQTKFCCSCPKGGLCVGVGVDVRCGCEAQVPLQHGLTPPTPPPLFQTPSETPTLSCARAPWAQLPACCVGTRLSMWASPRMACDSGARTGAFVHWSFSPGALATMSWQDGSPLHLLPSKMAPCCLRGEGSGACGQAPRYARMLCSEPRDRPPAWSCGHVSLPST